jgi:putative transposase
MLWDAAITEVLAGFYELDADGHRPPESLYGSLKMWAHLNREGIEVARCTVERLMRLNAWVGVTRRTRPRTTISDPDALERRPPDLVDRRFRVPAPDLLWVADFTYVVRIGGRWCYTAFTIGAFADTIVGWQTAATANAALVEASFLDAVQHRQRQGHPVAAGTIHHSETCPVHRAAVRRPARRGRLQTLDRIGRRRLRQRTGRDHHRPVQV